MVARGAVRYPSFTCSRPQPVFPSRAALLAYEEALEAAAALEVALQVRAGVCVLVYASRGGVGAWGCGWGGCGECMLVCIWGAEGWG